MLQQHPPLQVYDNWLRKGQEFEFKLHKFQLVDVISHFKDIHIDPY